MSAMQRFMSFLGFAEEEDGAEAPEGADLASEPRRRAPVFSLHTQRQLEIVVLEPQSFEDARRGADFVKARRPVVLNLRGAEKELSRRIVDFMSGVTYALEGHLQRVGDEIFLFTPSNVGIMAESAVGDRSSLFPMT